MFGLAEDQFKGTKMICCRQVYMLRAFVKHYTLLTAAVTLTLVPVGCCHSIDSICSFSGLFLSGETHGFPRLLGTFIGIELKSLSPLSLHPVVNYKQLTGKKSRELLENERVTSVKVIPETIEANDRHMHRAERMLSLSPLPNFGSLSIV